MSERATVLVIEDDDDLRQMLVGLLTGEGYHAVGAAEGREAIRLAERELPGLILLDMRMPGMNGTEFARHFRREMDPHGMVSLIGISASAEAEQWASEIGAAAVLSKPFELTELLDTIARLNRRS